MSDSGISYLAASDDKSQTMMSSPLYYQRKRTVREWKRQRIKVLYGSLGLFLGVITTDAMMVPRQPIHVTNGRYLYSRTTVSFATAASKVNDSVALPEEEEQPKSSPIDKEKAHKTPIPFDSWLDRTTARLLNMPPQQQQQHSSSSMATAKNRRVDSPHSPYAHYTSSSSGYIPLGELTIEDVQLITTLMTSHARRGTVESALICERLLKRVVEDVNAGNHRVRVTTKMYTVAMDAWAKSQRRPLPGTINYSNTKENEKSDVKSADRKKTQLQVHPQQLSLNDPKMKQQQIPLGAAAQRAHRIHNSLVETYRKTGDPHLAPSSVSYNAAINAWSKSYHPSAGEMAELLLGEMMREWRFGESDDNIDEEHDVEVSMKDWEDDEEVENFSRGNKRVRPDVVTFTAVIDAWVKCTALAHEYHYSQPPPNPGFYSTKDTVTKYRKAKENYAEWKRNQATKADALTKKAATRAKELLQLMIQLSHYDPSSTEKPEPRMRPNCYTYSAVMNALAKSCSALRAVSPSGISSEKGVIYDPAKEAQDMLESMIEKYERYKARVGEPETWTNILYHGANHKQNMTSMELEEDLSNSSNANPHWFDPRIDELTFPPNTVNYNSVLNAWSRASRYDSQSALRAEEILLDRMEKAQSEGGDAVEPDALSYSLVIHAWLRGCRGFNGSNGATIGKSSSKGAPHIRFTDHDRILRAMKIVDRMEAWARAKHQLKWKDYKENEDDEDDNNSYNEIIDELDSSNDIVEVESEDESDIDILPDSSQVPTRSSSTMNSQRVHNKARDLDAEVYNSILVAYLRELRVDHAKDVMRLLDRMDAVAKELDMPSVRPNQRSFNVALDVISKSAPRVNISLASYYDDVGAPMDKGKHAYNPLYAGRAAESLLSRMLANNFRPDAYAFASVLNTYQRIPKGRLEAALAADGVVRGMESLHFHNRIDDPPDVFHYTMVCACWSRSGEQGMAGERCSEILRHMQDRHKLGFARTKPNIRTYNAVIDAHAHNGRLEEAEDMLISMVDAYESSAARSMEGVDDEELPVRPDSFSFNTVIQQWARSRAHDGGKRAVAILDRMLEFHQNGNADVRPDDRSFSYLVHHYTKGSGRMAPNAPDKALALLKRMVDMYWQGYKDVIPANSNRTNPIFTFTSVIDAYSVLRRADAGDVGEELLGVMIKLGRDVPQLCPNTYTYLSVLYAWSSSARVDAGERATRILEEMESCMEVAAKEGRESIIRTTQRCYVLAQTAWARSPSEKKAEGALKVLEMMEKNYQNGNKDARPTVQAYSMVVNACAFADLVTDSEGKSVKSSQEIQLKAFRIAQSILHRMEEQSMVTSMIYGTFIKCCGRLTLPDDIAAESATRAFEECCRFGLVSDFVLTQMRYALTPDKFLDVLVKSGYERDSTGKMLSRDGKRMQRVRWNHLPISWRENVDPKYINDGNLK